jgi:hypothetical protein
MGVRVQRTQLKAKLGTYETYTESASSSSAGYGRGQRKLRECSHEASQSNQSDPRLPREDETESADGTERAPDICQGEAEYGGTVPRKTRSNTYLELAQSATSREDRTGTLET